MTTPPPDASLPQTPHKCECTIFYGGLAYEPNPDCPVHGKHAKPTDQELLVRFSDELDRTRRQLKDSQDELRISVVQQTALQRDLATLKAENKAFKEALDNRTREIANKRQKLAQCEEILSTNRQEIFALKARVEEMEGELRAIRQA